MSLIPQFKGDAERQLVIKKFEQLAADADALIREYNDQGFAYAAFAEFANEQASIDLPDCDCEGCKIYAN